MSSYFGLSIRFLDPAFHGRRDGGEPEWPPSPLRAFQSLVAAAGARGASRVPSPALKWLEQQPAPILVAPAAVTGSSYRLSVPNNEMDVVARAWSRGSDSNSGNANPSTHRAMKTVRATLMLDGDAVHYLWQLPEPLNDEVRGHIEALSTAARSVVSLGWGVDLVVGHGAVIEANQVAVLPGEHWIPGSIEVADGLRVPIDGTLEALARRHQRLLRRIDKDAFTAPPPLSVFEKVDYRRAIDPHPRPVAVFSLLRPDTSGFRAFDTARGALTVAGMMRHAARLAAENAGWAVSKINTFILGHAESEGADEHVPVGSRRFAYLPLPSIEPRGEGKARVVGSVRRVIVTTFAGDCQAEITWARRNLSGQELVDQKGKLPVALLSLIPETDKVVRQYTERAASWVTVTPVVLPGYDDSAHYRRRLKRGTSAAEQKQLITRLDRRVDGLLRKAISQAGFSTVLAENAELEWRKVGFWPGADLASRYGVPDHLRRFPRLHVKLHWRGADKRPVQVPGPVCIGGGRFYGLGLFAREGD
jgi:CRISPR-associated protein Csb2